MMERIVYDPFRLLADKLLYLGKLILFSEDGQKFIEDPGRYITEHYEDPDNKKEPFQPTTNFLHAKLGSMKAVEINPSDFTEETIKDIISGPGTTERQMLFSGLLSLLAWNVSFSWFTKQEIKKEEFPSHELLAKRLRLNFNKLDEVISRRLQREIAWMKENPIPDLRAWAYQFAVEILSEFVLGAPYVPDQTYAIFHEAEEGLIHYTAPTTLLGHRFHFTSRQKKFGELRDKIEHFTLDFIESNRDEIILGPGYLNDLLKDQAKKLGFDIDTLELSIKNCEDSEGSTTDREELKKTLKKVFEKDEVKSILAQGAKIVLLNASNFHKVLTVALLHLDEASSQKIHDFDLTQQKEFLKRYFYEAVRFASPTADTLRILPSEKKLTTKTDETITAPPGTVLFVGLRRSQRDPIQWDHPEIFDTAHFEGNDAPKIHTSEFAPFMMGSRMCPGRLLVEHTIKTVIQILSIEGFYIEVDNPAVKNLFDEKYWTVKGPVTGLQPGVTIGAKLCFTDMQAEKEVSQMPSRRFN